MSVWREAITAVRTVSTPLGHITALVAVDMNDMILMNAEVRMQCTSQSLLAKFLLADCIANVLLIYLSLQIETNVHFFQMDCVSNVA